MKRTLLALTLLAALPFAASAAEGVSYSYVEGGYVKNDISRDSDNFRGLPDADGWKIAGSYAFTPNFHVFADYSNQDFDKIRFNGSTYDLGDFDTWRIGLGYNHELSSRVDLLTRVAYEKLDYGSGLDLDGYSVEAGVRGSLAKNWEGYALAGYQDFDKGYDGKFYGRIGTLVKFNQSWGISADAKFVNGGQREYFIGPRFSF